MIQRAIITVLALAAISRAGSAVSHRALPSQLQLTASSISPPGAVQFPSLSDALSILLSSSSRLRGRRTLQDESNELDALNDVLSSIVITLPDAQLPSQAGVEVEIADTTCTGLTVRDIALSHDGTSDTSQSIDVNFSGVEITCDFSWKARWSVFGIGSTSTGDGEAASGVSSSISIAADFLSEDYDTVGPNDVNVDCDADLQISYVEVEDNGIGVIAAIINTLEGLFRDSIEGELNKLICNELTALGDDGGALNDMLVDVSSWIDDYLLQGGDSAASDANDDPLSAEKSSQLPTNEDGEPVWVNFVELQSFVEDLFNQEINQLIESVLDSTSSSEAVGGELSINAFIRSNLLNDDGLFVLDTSTLVSEEDAEIFELLDLFTVSIEFISIGGLDTFQEMNVLNPISNYTLQNSLKLEYLTLVMDMELVMQQSTSANEGSSMVAIADSDAPPIRESFKVEFTARDIELDFAIFLGINTQTLGSTSLGSVIYVSNILPCIQSAIDEAEITSISMSVSEIDPPVVTGFLDDGSGSGLDDIISTVINALFAMYEPVLAKALPNFFISTIKDLVNDFVEGELNEDGTCPGPDDSLNGLVDYRDLLLPEEEAVELLGRGGSPYGEVIRLVYSFFGEIVSNGDFSWLSSFIAQVAGLQSGEEGEIVLAGELVKQTVDISVGGLKALIEFSVSDIRISNLDSLDNLNLLQPVEGESSVLNNTASMGYLPANPVVLSSVVIIKGVGDHLQVYDEVELQLNMQNATMMLEVLAQMMEPSFLNFPMGDLVNVHCWLNTMVKPVIDEYGVRIGGPDTGLVPRDLAVNIAEAQLKMTCIECSSPMMADLEQAMQTQGGIEDTTEVINRLVAYGTDILGGEAIQSDIDQLINEAAYHCPHSPSYQQNFQGLEYEEFELDETPSDYSFLIAILIVIVVVALTSSLVYFIVRWVLRRRHNSFMSSLNDEQKLKITKMQQHEKEMKIDLVGRLRPLAMSKEVPLLIRVFIPIIIMGNIAFFLSGHLSLGGTVNLSGEFAGDAFNVQNFFEFSIAQSTIDMWKAGAKSLAILIALFSGIWPYTKQLTTLFVWFVPPTFFSHRGSLLRWLDILGKWSMIDVFVLLVTLASFRISVESPDNLRFLPEGLYSINMMVVPLWGLYAK